MFNPLEVSKQDVEQLFEVSSETVLVNDEPIQAIITLEQFMRETEDRNLHTLSEVNTGDLVTYQDEPYLIINETITKRHHKYKALMRHCNFTLRIRGSNIPSILSEKTFSIDESTALPVADNNVIMTVQDNETNRQHLEVNEEFEMLGYEYKVLHRNLTVKGLMIVTLQRGSRVIN